MSGHLDGYARIKEEILKRADIVSIVERYLPLKKSGNSYMGLCPFHNEKTPSFSLTPDPVSGGAFYCFGCQKGGDIFTFLMEKEGFTFIEAMKSLAAEYSIVWDIESAKNSEPAPSSNRFTLLKACDFAADFFYGEMKKSDFAKEYFKKRGISGETAKLFRLGFAPNSYDRLLSAARNAKFDDDTLIEASLVKKNDWNIFDFFRNRVIFPIFDTTGRPIAFGGRAIGDEMPKYLNSSNSPLYDKSRIFYGYFQAQNAIKQEKTAILVEGYMDMISLYQNGIKNVIAPCGTSFSQEHAVFLSRAAQKVIVVFDGDKAGISGAKKIIEKLLPLELEVRHVLIPQNEDPDDFVRKNGSDVFLELVKNSQEGFSFCMECIEKERNINESVGKSRALKDIAVLLGEVKNEIILSDFITKISTRWKIDPNEIKRGAYGRLKNENQNLSADDETQNFQDENKRVFYTEEGRILQLLFCNPNLFSEHKNEINDDFFAERIVNRLFLLMKNGDFDRDNFLTCEILSAREKAFLLILANENPNDPEEEAKRQLIIKLNRLRKIDLQKKNENLRDRIREESDEKKRIAMLAELAENQKGINALHKKKTELK